LPSYKSKERTPFLGKPGAMANKAFGRLGLQKMRAAQEKSVDRGLSCIEYVA
jgi:hypothetical protein